MISMEDAARAALDAQEAALLPALIRPRSIAGRLALREKLDAAAQMERMQVQGEFHDLEKQVRQAEAGERRRSRAALHQALRK